MTTRVDTSDAIEPGRETPERPRRRRHGLLRSLSVAQLRRLRARVGDMRELPECDGEPRYGKPA